MTACFVLALTGSVSGMLITAAVLLDLIEGWRERRTKAAWQAQREQRNHRAVIILDERRQQLNGIVDDGARR